MDEVRVVGGERNAWEQVGYTEKRYKNMEKVEAADDGTKRQKSWWNGMKRWRDTGRLI